MTDQRFLAAWEAIDAPDRAVLVEAGWTAEHLPAVEAALTGSGRTRASRELTLPEWANHASTIACNWYGTLDPVTVIAWMTVRAARPNLCPEPRDMCSWTRDHIGLDAPYAWAAGLDFNEARNHVQARNLHRDRLRALAGLRGIFLP